jgi:hypothetical protein
LKGRVRRQKIIEIFESFKDVLKLKEIIDALGISFSTYYRYRYEILGCSLRLKGSVVGQGQLKKVNFDPLFVVNHTCAMMRANINRLIRKTWCTTKDPLKLKDHLDVFIYFYNQSLLKKAQD